MNGYYNKITTFIQKIHFHFMLILIKVEQKRPEIVFMQKQNAIWLKLVFVHFVPKSLSVISYIWNGGKNLSGRLNREFCQQFCPVGKKCITYFADRQITFLIG